MSYSPGLDGLRAVAVVAVLCFHARMPGVSGGYLGVDVFFVLSGFLITRLLAQEIVARGRVDLLDFYLRRLQRLYPALLLMLVAYLTLAPLVFGAAPHTRDATIAAMYLADYAYAFWQVPQFLKHTWSLAVEVKFYLLWPPVLLFLWRLTPRGRIQAILGLAALATLWRWSVVVRIDDWVQPYYRFDTRLSGILLGCAIGVWQPRIPVVFGWVGLGAVLIAIHFANWATSQGLVIWLLCAEIGAALLILSADRLSPLRHPVMAWVGRMSYGIYLWHYPFTYWMRKQGFQWGETVIVGGVAGTACAALSYYTIESVIRSYRRRKSTHARITVAKPFPATNR